MAPRKSAPDVLLRHDEDGDTYQLGFVLEGAFVPVASVSGGYARALAGAGAPEPVAENDDESEA